MNSQNPDELTHIFDSLGQKDFDVVKVLLDKGALALVIVLVGFVISLSIERFKSVLARQQEILKITAPMVARMIKASDELYKAGLQELRGRAEDFSYMEDWVNELLSLDGVSVKQSFDIPVDEAMRDAPMTVHGVAKTLQEHMLANATIDAVKVQLASDDFWKMKEVTSGDGSFMRHLYMAYMQPVSARGLLGASVHYQAARVFAAMGVGLSQKYVAALEEFRRLMISNLYPGNKKQMKAIKGMYVVIEANLETFKSFPINDIGRYRFGELANPNTTLEVLGANHASLTGLIGQYLRSQ